MSELYAIIDVETTGGSATRDRITEVAIVVYDGKQVVNSFESLVNPECNIPYGITELTGITNDMVANAPKFYEIARDIFEMTKGTVFVAHNVRFDYGFIKEEFNRLGFTFSRKQLCTVRLARQTFPGLHSYSLGNLIRHFNIEVADRHRAMADVSATLEVFRRVFDEQHGSQSAQQFINLGIKETRLPHGISLEYLHNLPEATGVYYFHDSDGEVLYVGKSINIRKRIMEHFADHTRKAADLQQRTASISFELTGSELVALLLESHEIKTIRPPVNRAQRQKVFPFYVHSFQNSEGYTCFEIGSVEGRHLQQHQILNEFAKLSLAKSALARVKDQFNLCPKYLGLERPYGACFDHHLKICQGACIGLEPAADYNARATEAAEVLSNVLEGNYFILDAGRHATEKSVVLVKNGNYYGYGFLDLESGYHSPEEMEDFIVPQENNAEVKRIIRRYLGDAHGYKIIRF